VQQLPLAAASFDTVVSTFPTPYIYDPAALQEIARVLRPGGRLVVVEGASLLPANLLLWPFVLVQALAYGHAVSAASFTIDTGRRDTRRTVHTYPVSPLRSRIPLAQAGLLPREELDATRWWTALIVIGEKPQAP
jgi:SAM-dependent methyltransferase